MFAWAKIEADEDWNGPFDTWDEALQDAKQGTDGDFYVGKCELVPLIETVDAYEITYDLGERYSNESGCDYDIYDGVEGQHMKWLEEQVEEVIREFHKRAGVKPCWHSVESYEKVER